MRFQHDYCRRRRHCRHELIIIYSDYSFGSSASIYYEESNYVGTWTRCVVEISGWPVAGAYTKSPFLLHVLSQMNLSIFSLVVSVKHVDGLRHVCTALAVLFDLLDANIGHNQPFQTKVLCFIFYRNPKK